MQKTGIVTKRVRNKTLIWKIKTKSLSNRKETMKTRSPKEPTPTHNAVARGRKIDEQHSNMENNLTRVQKQRSSDQNATRKQQDIKMKKTEQICGTSI